MRKPIAMGLLLGWACTPIGCNRQPADSSSSAAKGSPQQERSLPQGESTRSVAGPAAPQGSDQLNGDRISGSPMVGGSATPETENAPAAVPKADFGPVVANAPGSAARRVSGPNIQDQTGLANSTFMSLQPTESNDPNELVEHLRRVDVAIGDLVRAGTNNIIEKTPYEEAGIRLAKMKLSAGERLANAKSASDEQRKAGVLSQLEALSHLSSLGDVASAKQLIRLAEALTASNDPDLSRQGRVVLIGFELQALENGISSDPAELLSQSERLFGRPEDRNFPSFMMLRQAHSILLQLGFQEASQRIKEIITAEFLESADPQLRGEAWMYAARDTQALAAYNQASRSFGTEQFDAASLLAAMRILYDALPYPATLEQLASAVANFEYGGEVVFSQQVADFVEQQLAKLPDQTATGLTHDLLSQHRARTGLLGRPLALNGLVSFDGMPLDWKSYEGKTLLIDFWATWCLPCLKEIPSIQAAYSKYSDRGFDVIGINMDENVAQAASFIEQKQYAWRNFYFDGQPGFESEFAKSHGLTMIPFIVIVGPDGNVARIHARGNTLDKTLESLLDPSKQ